MMLSSKTFEFQVELYQCEISIHVSWTRHPQHYFHTRRVVASGRIRRAAGYKTDSNPGDTLNAAWGRSACAAHRGTPAWAARAPDRAAGVHGMPKARLSGRIRQP